MTKGFAKNLYGDQPHINVARYIKGKSNHFEVVIDPDLAMKFRNNQISDVRDVLKNEGVFIDAKKGLRPTETELKETFGTADHLKIAEKIIREGLIQVSEKFREEQKEIKRRRIVDLIHQNCVDSKTELPHPATRIENAMREAKVRIDDNKSAENQLQDIIKQLRAILPIKFEIKELEINVPLKHASRAHGVIKQLAKVTGEKWNTDGSLSCTADLPAGMQDEFFEKINSLTHGEAEIKVIRSK
jgi:ribosome maturation protein SDO1